MTQQTPFGKYLLLERINVGGMAEVFKAKAFGIEGFERTLAIKRILPNMADDEEFINMFIDEARICVQLSHANIVPVFELGRLDNQYYIAMEYVPGRDLRNVLDRFRKRERLLPLPAAAFITAKICDGLDYAHRKTDASSRPLNLIHRDVSPQNILLSYEGAIKITDFGIAKAEDRASKTQAGVLKGKFAYMSPEQVRGLEIDQRSDIFAVGILLYEMATGKRLFVGESDFATLEKVRAAQVQPPREHNPEISEDFERVILKALARDRDERYANASELAEDLQPFLISDNTVFTGKKLGELLHEEYATEIEAERKRNEEFARLPPPSARDQQVAEKHLSAPAGADWGRDGRPEKTVIFESDFGAASPLSTTGAFHTDESVFDPSASERPTLAMDEQSSASYVGVRPATSLQVPKRTARAWGGAIAAVVLVAALAAFAWQRFTLSNQTGTLVVTSTPTEQVNVYLDGLLIAQHTPYTLKGVGAGSHRLVVRAPGFRDKAYRFDFDFSQGTTAEIKVELERDAAPVLPGETSLDVTSEPPMASVRLGGLPQGTTPLTLMTPDTSHAILLEVSRDGYLTQTLSVTFAPGERQKHVHVRLVPVGARPGGGAGGRGGPSLASLTVRSRPERATVYLGGVRKGVSPMVITDLNPSATYVVEVVRDGYRPFESIVHMNGRSNVDVQAELVAKAGTQVPVGDGGARRMHGGSGSCGGSGGKWSILAMSVGDCRVTVGRQPLGVAPMFKKDGPVGRCVVEVTCPGGKRYTTTRQMRAGGEEKIIIKASDWQ